MTPVPPVWAFATRNARSFASLPVQVNITWPSSVGKMAEQSLGVIENRFVQVARMGIEDGGLSRQGRDHVRMAMPDRRDVVVDVEIGVAFGIVEPHAFAAHDMNGVGVEQPIGRPEKAPAPRDHLLLVGRDIG